MKKKNIILLFIVAIIIIFSINVSASSASCSEIIPTGDGSLMSKLDVYVYKPIKWITPTLLLVLTSFDFAKVVFSGDSKGMEKAKNNFLKRLIAALIIFFAPDLIKLIVGFLNDKSMASCLQGNFK